MTMSGLFERIARRRATPPDETQEPDAPATAGPASTGDEPAPTEVLATGEAAAAAPEEGVRSEAVAGEAPTADQTGVAGNGGEANAEQREAPTAERGGATANGEAPTAEQSAAPTAEQRGVQTEEQSAAPTAEQSAAPTAEQSAAPTAEQSAAPTADQTTAPTADQTTAPTAEASAAPADAPTEVLPPDDPRPSFRERGRVRRRVRYLRRLRELQLRDLGGLVFELRRFGRRREDLVNQKLTQLAATDEELRHLETLLDDRRAVVELREPGIGGTCPNCGALHGSADHYCAHCGRPLDPGAANGAAAGEATTEPLAE